MVKNYTELDQAEVLALIDFVDRNGVQKTTFEQLHKQFGNEEFDQGKGIIIMFDGKNVMGKVQVVLKVCSTLGMAYIIKMDLLENLVDAKAVAATLMVQAIETAKTYDAKDIYIGAREERIKALLDALDYKRSFQAFVLTLSDRILRYAPLELVELNENNKLEYIDIHNEAFSDTPNGNLLSVKNVDAYIRDTNLGNFYFIVQAEGQNIGMLQVNIEEKEGKFDIGLKRAWRGKGYGLRLLETAIDFLNQKSVQEVGLIVISKNTLAYDMYLKRGFVFKNVLSDWYTLD